METSNFNNLLIDQLTAIGYTLEEFKKGYKKSASASWKRGYAAAHGLVYGSYIEAQMK